MRVGEILPAILAAALIVPPGPDGSGPGVPAILKEFDRICARPFWPDFHPCQIPLAVFDGRVTWLVRHPRPPEQFAAAPERKDARVFEGRHADLRANTSVEIAGVPTASATLERRSETPRRLAALLVHEAFHVFQAKRHPKWGGNEVDLFVYPLEDAEALALRRLESESLRRGLAARRSARSAAWAARALEIRRERFARLPGQAAAYERGTEMKEGLARYVEAMAEGDSASLFPELEFPAQSVRERAYASGAAMALLLDHLDPDWKRRLEQRDDSTFEDLLERAAAAARRIDFRGPETEEARRRAAEDVAVLMRRREQLRRGFVESPGWKVVLEADDPVFPQKFDPWNVERLSASEVLHTRWVKLGNASGSLEALGRRCLTESAGKHPLFEGLRRATVELPSEPRVEETPQSIKISAEGLTLEFRGARLSRSGQTWTVILPRSPDRPITRSSDSGGPLPSWPSVRRR